MNCPKVSIIVPVYNVEKYLACCIDSLLHQTLTDIEIILVDDGSPDHCPAMCDKYAKQDHRIRVIHKRNEGLGYARNSGLEIATGEYIAFVDSDDYVETNVYQKLYSLAMDTKVDIIYYLYKRFDNQGNIWQKAKSSGEIRYTEEGVRGLMLDLIANRPNAKLDRNISCSSCSALYRHDIIKRHGLKFKSERELISEDMLFNIDCLLHSSSVITIPDALYYYRVNPSSLSNTECSDGISSHYYFYQYLLKVLKANNFGVEGYLRATRLFIGYSRNEICQYIQTSRSKKEKMQWLKEAVSYDIWKEIASSYPYRELPLKSVVHYYLLYKGYYRLLYYYSKSWSWIKSSLR